jgi:hypothetical protein
MIDRYFHFYYVKPIFVAYLLNQLYRPCLDFFSLKDTFEVTRIVDRMTRSFDHHACYISCLNARAYEDKGDAPLPLITPWGRHAFTPAASRGDECKGLAK